MPKNESADQQKVEQVVVHHDGEQIYTLECDGLVRTQGTLDQVVSYIRTSMPHITSFPVKLKKERKNRLACLLSSCLT